MQGATLYLIFKFQNEQCCPFIMLCLRSLGIDLIISELYHKGTILQRNSRKILILKFHGKKIGEPQHEGVISKSV